MLTMNRALAGRVAAAEAGYWTSLLQALSSLPGNPYGAATARFGHAWALRCPGMAGWEQVNRVMCTETVAAADLEAASAFVGAPGCAVDAIPPFCTREWLAGLARRGFRHADFEQLLAGPAAAAPAPSPAVDVRPAATASDVAAAAGIFPAAFGLGGEWAGWFADLVRAVAGAPGWQLYLGWAAGRPVAAGLLYVAGDVGYLAGAGTLPAARGQGFQTALIGRRMAAAAAAGCDLVCSQTNNPVSQANLERAGLRLVYTKAVHVPE